MTLMLAATPQQQRRTHRARRAGSGNKTRVTQRPTPCSSNSGRLPLAAAHAAVPSSSNSSSSSTRTAMAMPLTHRVLLMAQLACRTHSSRNTPQQQQQQQQQQQRVAWMISSRTQSWRTRCRVWRPARKTPRRCCDPTQRCRQRRDAQQR
jgi:hypothetical protein